MKESRSYQAGSHAMAPVGEYRIPLIGVPVSAVEEVCDQCGCKISGLIWAFVSGRFKIRCWKCQNGSKWNPDLAKMEIG
jgi:hypothetical protein